MAGNKDTALRSQRLAHGKPGPATIRRTRKSSHKTKKSKPVPRGRRGERFLRFREAEGKTVEFVEMYTDAEFPCVEIGFADRTALHFLMDTRLTMEPTYTNWKTGNLRILRRWPVVECR